MLRRLDGQSGLADGGWGLASRMWILAAKLAIQFHVAERPRRGLEGCLPRGEQAEVGHPVGPAPSLKPQPSRKVCKSLQRFAMIVRDRAGGECREAAVWTREGLDAVADAMLGLKATEKSRPGREAAQERFEGPWRATGSASANRISLA